MTDPEPRMTVARFHEMCGEDAPFIAHHGFDVRGFGYGTATAAMAFDPGSIRPGGTISGPAMFALADFTLWLAVLGAYGAVPLAVTTNMSINFLRKPRNATLVAEATLFKPGKRLAVGEVRVSNEGAAEPCAHVTGTYSIPPGTG